MTRRPLPRSIHRRTRVFLPLALCLATGALTACNHSTRRGDADLQVAIEIEPSPPQVGHTTVAVVVSEVDWTPRNGATVVLTGTRDSVLLVLDTARGQGAGRYETDGFGFEVAGEWLLSVRVETTDGRWVEMDQPVRVTAAAPDDDAEEEGEAGT